MTKKGEKKEKLKCGTCTHFRTYGFNFYCPILQANVNKMTEACGNYEPRVWINW